MKNKVTSIVVLIIVFLSFAGKSFSQNTDKIESDIDSFWGCFKEAITDNDTIEVARMIEFPLNGAQSNVRRYDSKGLQRVEFSKAYPNLFGDFILRKIDESENLSPYYPSLNIHSSLPKTDDGKYYHLTVVEKYEDEFGSGTFTAVMIFGLIDSKYKLIEVSYAG